MMAEIELLASDGHRFAAYRADSVGSPRGGLVVLQEIFGVNAHIRDVADGFARDGFVAIAPALFDRAERGIELGYDESGFAKGRELAGAVGFDGPVLDMTACVEALRPLSVGVVGYCWGGALAWLAATRIPNVVAAVGYYGRHIATHLLGEMPRVPVMLHYGARDTHIPVTDVARVQAAHPEMSIFTYDAGHGFNCDMRADYDADAARLARARTLEFFNDRMDRHG